MKEDGRIDRGSLWSSFLYHRYGNLQATEAIYGETFMGVESDGMSKMNSLYILYSYVCLS